MAIIMQQQINNPKKNDYDRLFKIVAIVMVSALAVLLILVVILFASGAFSDAEKGDNIVIVTGDEQSQSETAEESQTTDESLPVTDNQGLVFPGGETSAPAQTEPVQTTSSPETEASTQAIQTGSPIEITDDNSSVPCYTGLSGIENEFPGTVLTTTDDMGDSYLDDIVFLGDSLTYGLKVYGMLDDGRDTKQVWVPSNGTLLLNNVADAKIVYPDTGSEITVSQAIAAKKPTKLIISLGINGISYLDEDGFIAQLTSLINEVKKDSPDTVIILQSMFPIATTYEYQGSINNNKICHGNYWMAKAASENGVYFLNTAEALVGKDGFLAEDMQSGDGLHINTTAYNIVLNYIRTHGISADS
jgi:Lysophospholipase L1 and related esterases